MSTLPEVLLDVANQINRHADQLIELRQSVLGLAASLANQPGIDRPKLCQDFVTMLRAAGGNPDSPSREMQSLLRALGTPHEHTNALSLGEKLLRASAMPPHPDADPKQ
jgi:hypothetical protein